MLTKKDAGHVTKNWEHSQQGAFDGLKEKLVEAPVLALPNFYKDFILEADAPSKQLGAVLM